MARVLLLNGPNLNLLGSREPGLYGSCTLESIEKRAVELAREAGHELSAFQSNAEHELIERIHRSSADGVEFLIFNPGAFTHTSVALRDAILGVKLPFIELHLSNTQAREPFRRHSYFSDIAVGVIAGLGAFGYELAVRAAVRQLARP
ncbi:MAG: 3-dehydroquinate dehydratase [Gammaproteobacteria bacterium]|jgi:3-dehydroquinate dehydratase-2|nr:3-dehydroquinate dehydratase [Gammaproteobacteria bacterium]